MALVAVGLAGIVLPALPGTVLIFAGLLLAAWTDGFARVGVGTLLLIGLLGAVSYSIYLLHCIVLFVVVTLVDAHTPIAQLPVEHYWMFATLAGMATVLLSLVTYRHVEHPFIAGRQRPARAASAHAVAGGLARPAAGD